MGYVKKIILAVVKPLGLLSPYHFIFGWVSSVLYRHPSRKMIVIGVTGTKGKTTVLELANAIIETAGEKTVLSSSTRFKVAEKEWTNDTGNTMPGRGFLQKLLREGVKAGCKYALVEVVSEGVVQYRHRFIDFDVAVFTGIHPEHIESHGSFKKYLDAKLSFFRDVRKHSKKEGKYFVINKDDKYSESFTKAAGRQGVIPYTLYDGPLKLIGDFNKRNAAAASAIARAIGAEGEVIRRALEEFEGVPGRMELVQRDPFAVMIDYAHTPDSLSAVYETLSRDMPKGGRLICVFGSMGGGRDRWKRPELGRIAGDYCSEVILTNEDPVDEDPAKIIGEIKAGIEGHGRFVHEIVDRREAIRKAVDLARSGDTVIITGKGREPYIRVAKGKKLAWSDWSATREVLAQKK